MHRQSLEQEEISVYEMSRLGTRAQQLSFDDLRQTFPKVKVRKKLESL